MNLNVSQSAKCKTNGHFEDVDSIEQSLPITIGSNEILTLPSIESTAKCPLVELNTNTDNNLDTQFSRSSVGGAKYLMSVHPTLPDSCDLVFESRFESGNLAKAVKITPVYYELYLRTDMYTNRHSQWFYFRVTNTRKGIPYRYTGYI